MLKVYKIIFTVFVFILLSTFYFLLSKPCHGATLSFEPVDGQYSQGESFIKEIRVDNQGESLNAFEIYLKYPAQFLEVTDVNFSDSILNFIIDQPVVNQKEGTINFSGIVPGGYYGRVPGDPGAGNLVAKIIFKVKKQENLLEAATAEIYFTNKSKILLNDGKATLAALDEKGTRIEILNQVIESENDVLLGEDRIPPEIFKPEIDRSPDIFNNQWFIVFSAQDKNSGLDHYEIQESNIDHVSSVSWLKVESPYLLKDQSLKSYIFIKAVDKKGNEQKIAVEPKNLSKSLRLDDKSIIWVIIVLGLLTLVFIWFYIIKHRRKIKIK
jgi:hypothetical protein